KVAACHAHGDNARGGGAEEERVKQDPTGVRGQGRMAITVAERLGAMDEQGIDMEVLSINPSWYRLEREIVEKAIRINNEGLADLCGKHPDRFAALASLALQFPDLAVQQLEYAMKKVNPRGAGVDGTAGR